jgi:hypothetical protein
MLLSSLLFNNPSVPSALAVSGLLILFWITLFWATVKAIKRDPKRPFKLVLTGLASLLVVAVPLLLYLVVTMFVLIDFK